MKNDNFAFREAGHSFIPYCYLQNPQYVCKEFHNTIAQALTRTIHEKNLRILIEAPPRHGKSHTTSELFPSWYLGKAPERSIILGSYGQDLANDFGRKVKNNVDNEIFTATFPGVSLSKDSKSQKRFNTNKGGGYYAVGRGGPVTGRGGDLILLDDLLKDGKEARSSLIRKECIDWFKSTLYTRLMPNGSIIIIATRWHEEDIIGWALNSSGEKWERYRFQAITDNKALWPERYSLQDLQRIKKVIGTKNFESLYQQNPRPDEGSIIKRKWLKYYRELPNHIDEYIQSWDMSFKDADTSDFVVCGVYARKGSNFYLVHQLRKRMDFPATLKAFIEMSDRYPASAKLVEAKANGQAIIDTLDNHITGIIAVNPTDSKSARLSAVAPAYEAGNVHYPHPDNCEWIEDHVEEVISFPDGKFDDRVDTESQALSRLQNDSRISEVYNDIENKILV